jgi:hypothetical protein
MKPLVLEFATIKLELKDIFTPKLPQTPVVGCIDSLPLKVTSDPGGTDSEF